METGACNRRVRLRVENTDSPRHRLDARQDSPSFPRREQLGDAPTGERLCVSMTEDGPAGDYRMTMQRDQHGRWIPTKGREGTMTINKARRRDETFYVRENKEH